MRFPPAFLDDIRARIPISQVVGRKVTWDKRKTNPSRGDYWACCPFHGEKTPSFHAENRKGRYHCFGCGVSGDHFTFLVEQEGLSFPEAVALLAQEAGIPLPELDPDSERREVERATLHEVVEKAAKFFEATLQGSDGAKARAYLRERGLSPEVQKRFRLGYALPSRNALKEHLATAEISQEQMVEAGLLIAGEEIPVSYDRFRDRIIFPINDFRGRVIAFGGRALSPDAQAKYLNSPETPLFHKSHVLYNGQAARAASRAGQVIVVEGYVDVIACASMGFEATVAPLGTALTEDQLRMLWQMADEPILCFDGDDAGLKAAFRAVHLALADLKPGKSVKFALLPGGQDPDDFLRREGPEPFRRILDAAKPLVDMLWLSAAHGLDLATPERRAGLEQTLRAAVAAIRDPDVRRHYETAVRERAAVQFGQGRRAPYRRTGDRQPPNQRRFPPPHPTGPSASLLAHPMVRGGGQSAGLNRGEAILLGVLILHPEIAAERLESLSHAQFAGKALSAVAAALTSKLAESPGISTGELREDLIRAGHGEAVAAILEKLIQSGLGGLAKTDPDRAAAIWDDAAHLRLRTGALSIERQAAASAFARESNDVNLSRLRDIQEQDQRTLRPDQRDETEGAMIVHPFKRR
jgi:DNA primase